MNDNRKYGAISSSYDPQQISTTVLATSKMVAGALVFFGVLSVGDSTSLLNAIPQLLSNVLAVVPLGYAAWNAAEVIYGIIRKVLVGVFKNPNAPNTMTIVVPAPVSSTVS